MADLIHPYSHRPKYEFTDGTGDLTFGAWFLMFSLMVQLSQRDLGMWRWLAVTYGLIAATWGITHFGIRAIRSRLIYRRSGYVRMRQRPREVVSVMLMGVAIAAASAVYFARTGIDVFSPPLIVGLLLGLIQLVAAAAQRLWRYLGYAVVSILIGVMLQFVKPSLVSGVTWYWLLMAIAFLIGGAMTLYLFVRHTPPQNSEIE
jgi:hypothetical protein